MEKQVLERLNGLLKSNNKEMCQLAVTMFNGLTNHYGDYFQLRTLYDSKSIIIHEENAKIAFNEMFNNIDKSTIERVHKKYMNYYRRTTLTSKQKRQKNKKDAQERIKLATN